MSTGSQLWATFLCVQAVDRLGRDLPVLLQNEGWEDAAEEIDDIFVGDAEIWCDSSGSPLTVLTGACTTGSVIEYPGPA